MAFFVNPGKDWENNLTEEDIAKLEAQGCDVSGLRNRPPVPEDDDEEEEALSANTSGHGNSLLQGSGRQCSLVVQGSLEEEIYGVSRYICSSGAGQQCFVETGRQ